MTQHISLYHSIWVFSFDVYTSNIIMRKTTTLFCLGYYLLIICHLVKLYNVFFNYKCKYSCFMVIYYIVLRSHYLKMYQNASTIYRMKIFYYLYFYPFINILLFRVTMNMYVFFDMYTI